MIKESLYFSFAGRKSTEFGILNVSVQSGLYEETFMSSRSIRETTVRGNPKPYFTEIERQPKVFTLNFLFEDNFNEELINNVTRWLNVDYYEPLFFSENIDKVFYAMPVEDTNLIHNGLQQGYLTLTFRCDSPFSYGHESTTPWYDCSSGETTIEFPNRGTNSISLVIEITKIEDGDLTIQNLSNYNNEFKLSNLKNGENLTIYNSEEEIITDIPNKDRYDDFNDNYLSLSYGNNVLQVTGKCKLRFIYQYVFTS
jgi:predicted phage tail component-like protein